MLPVVLEIYGKKLKKPVYNKPQIKIMKKFIFLFFACITYETITAQMANEITTDKPANIDDIEYGYFINNESVKEAGGKEMSRFEVTLYAKNTSSCLKLFLFERKNTFFSSNTSAENDLAKFDCINATGQRLTSKGGTIEARSFYTNAKVPIKGTDGKTTVQDLKVQIGYALKPGETISKSLIFIVPLNEKPKLQVRAIYNPATF